MLLTGLFSTKDVNSAGADGAFYGKAARQACEVGKRCGALELPLSVKCNKEAFFEDSFLLKRESSKGTVVYCNEILEINFLESEYTGRRFPLTFANC